MPGRDDCAGLFAAATQAARRISFENGKACAGAAWYERTRKSGRALAQARKAKSTDDAHRNANRRL